MAPSPAAVVGLMLPASAQPPVLSVSEFPQGGWDPFPPGSKARGLAASGCSSPAIGVPGRANSNSTTEGAPGQPLLGAPRGTGTAVPILQMRKWVLGGGAASHPQPVQSLRDLPMHLPRPCPHPAVGAPNPTAAAAAAVPRPHRSRYRLSPCAAPSRGLAMRMLGGGGCGWHVVFALSICGHSLLPPTDAGQSGRPAWCPFGPLLNSCGLAWGLVVGGQ